MASTFNAMSTFAARTLLFVAVLSAVGPVAADESIDSSTYQGCFSSSTPLKNQGSYTYQSSGYCRKECSNSAVFGLSNGKYCWCGAQLPASSDKVSDSKCNVGCQGYDSEDCGGDGYWSVYTVEEDADVSNYGDDDSGSGSSTTTAGSATKTNDGSDTVAPSIITSVKPGTTVRITLQPSAESSATAGASNSTGDSSGTNTAGIAAGVVVGVVAFIALLGLGAFFIRRRRRQATMQEYAKNNQVQDFMRGTSDRKPPVTGYSQMSDSRLDPEAGARRNSSGSIADSGDYSRRILRVANPDRD